MSIDNEFPTSELDFILADTAQELDDQLRVSVDLNAAFLKLMAADTRPRDESPTLAAVLHSEREADKAASLIAIRAKIRELRRDLDLVCNLDQCREYDRHLERPRDPLRDLVHDDLRERILGRAHDIVCALDLVDASPGVVDRADDLVRALILDRDVNLAITRSRALARTITILDALNLREGYADIFHRFRVLGQVHDLAQLLSGAGDVDSPLNWAVDLSDSYDQVQAIDQWIGGFLERAGDIVGTISPMQEWRRLLDRVYRLERELTRAYPRKLTSDLINDLLSDLASDLEMVHIDASGLDLHHIDLREVDVLTGVLWTADTIWPAGITEEVRARSTQISLGIFQVIGPGTEHQIEDNSTPSH